MKLNKTERNKIVESVERAGVELSDFQFNLKEEKLRIDHRATASFIVVRHKDGKYSVNSVVGDYNPVLSDTPTFTLLAWEIEKWAKRVVEDLETPDLWSGVLQGQARLSSPVDQYIANTSFTETEQEEIKHRLQAFAEYAQKEYHLSEEQMQALNASISYLQESVTRLGRVDWKSAAIGTLFSFFVNIAIPADAARGLMFRFSADMNDFVEFTVRSLGGD